MYLSPVFCLVGAPGSGKTTLAKDLETGLNFKRIVMGDLLRAHPEHSKGLGQGNFAPDDVAIDLLLDELMPVLGHFPVVIDGFPRNIDQRASLDHHLTSIWPQGRSPFRSHIIAVGVTPQVAVQRLSMRGEGREDDTLDVIEKRMEQYLADTEPLLRHAGHCSLINGDGSPEETYLDAVEVIKGLIFFWWRQDVATNRAGAAGSA